MSGRLVYHRCAGMGRGGVEWTTTDAPCIGLCSDSPTDVLEVALGDDAVRIECPTPGVPIFLQLPPLARGRHTLRVLSTQRADGSDFTESDTLTIDAREPRPWNPGSSSASAFYVIAEPSNASLEQLWEGEVAFQVFGSASQRVNSEVSLFERASTGSLLTKHLPPLRPPVSTDAWRTHFDRHFRDREEAQNAYDLAHSCQVHIAAAELGQFTYEAERAFVPLRWVAQRTRGEV